MATTRVLDAKYGLSINNTGFVDSSRNITSGTVNKVTITSPATASTLTIADGKTLTVSNTLTFTGTDASSVAFGAGGTVVYTSSTLAGFASTSSLQLAGVISDETGYTTGAKLVFSTSPSFETSVTTSSTSFDVFNVTASTVNAFGAATTLTIGAATGTTTVRNNLVISGNLQVDGTSTIVNSTITSYDDPVIVLGGDTSTVEATKDRGIEFKWSGATVTMTNYIGNATTTVTGTTASTTGWAAGDIITISGATGAGAQANLNGTWTLASVPTGTTFTFVVTSAVAAGTYTTNIGTTVRSKNGFFGLDQSTGRFTFIPQANNASEVFSGTVGDLEIGDLILSSGDITSGAAVASTLFSTTTTGNVSLANGLTTGTLRIGSANGSGQVDIGNTGTAVAQAVNIATATTGTITIGGTGATAVQLPTGKTKIGTSTLAEGSAFTYSLPTAAANATLAITANKLNVFAATTSAELAGVISDETGTGALVFATSPTLVTPTLGIATATSINKVTITAPATSATLTIADGKTLTVSNTLTFTGTDASSVAFGAGGTVAYTGGNLGQFASTTSALLAGVISDETGFTTGAKLVFSTSPSFETSVTTSSASFDVFNTTATTVNAFGAVTTLALANTGTGARTINVATGASGGASTLTFGGAVSGNTLKVASTTSGSISLTTDVTTGIANIFTSVTGTVNIGGVGSEVYIGTQTAIGGTTTTVATVTQTATDTISAAEFRSAEYLVQITQASTYQISKILLVHDGTTTYITEYGTVTSGGSVLGTLDADISGGNIRLLVTMGSTTSASVKVARRTIIV
jgi:hypothetical protein